MSENNLAVMIEMQIEIVFVTKIDHKLDTPLYNITFFQEKKQEIWALGYNMMYLTQTILVSIILRKFAFKKIRPIIFNWHPETFNLALLHSTIFQTVIKIVLLIFHSFHQSPQTLQSRKTRPAYNDNLLSDLWGFHDKIGTNIR